MNKIQPRWTKMATTLCAGFDAEDGVDPRYLSNKSARKKSSAKDMQLGKEAQRVLSLVLAGETQNPLLRDLVVLSVLPEGHGQRLEVTVGHYDAVDEALVLTALNHAHGRLRTLLAQSLHRKRVPLLSFSVLDLRAKESC